MFARYDQDLTPFFVRIRAEERLQRKERHSVLRESLNAVLHLLGRRQKV